MGERTLRELYYKPFEIVCEAKPVSAMCSYNRVNGTFASEYKKGFDVLRGELGFDGAVYSDWDSVRDRTKAAKPGVQVLKRGNLRTKNSTLAQSGC